MLYGSAAGLSAAGNQSGTRTAPASQGAAQSGDSFGDALAAGDFNNDGFDDLAIGVPGETVGGSRTPARSTCFYGSAAGLTAAGDQLWHQDVPGVLGTAATDDLFGFGLA